jgi:hypothetical protein
VREFVVDDVRLLVRLRREGLLRKRASLEAFEANENCFFSEED